MTSRTVEKTTSKTAEKTTAKTVEKSQGVITSIIDVEAKVHQNTEAEAALQRYASQFFVFYMEMVI